MDSVSTTRPDYDCASRGTYPDVPLGHVKAFSRAFRESVCGKERKKTTSGLVTSNQKGCSWIVLQSRTLSLWAETAFHLYCGDVFNVESSAALSTVVVCLMLDSLCNTVVMCLMLESSAVLW